MHAAIDLVYVRLTDGGVAELGLGDPLPDDADEAHVGSLLAAGVVTVEAVTTSGDVVDVQVDPPAASIEPGTAEPTSEAKVDGEAVEPATSGRGRQGKA